MIDNKSIPVELISNCDFYSHNADEMICSQCDYVINKPSDGNITKMVIAITGDDLYNGPYCGFSIRHKE